VKAKANKSVVDKRLHAPIRYDHLHYNLQLPLRSGAPGIRCHTSTFGEEMTQHEKTMIEVGARFDFGEEEALNLARSIPREYFRILGESRYNKFDFLVELPFPDAFNFTKGLVRCEEARLSPYPGSTSLVIWAFNALQRRPIPEWAEIAIWIVQNHDNPFSPFNFRRTRDHWENAMREAHDPIEIVRRAAEIERNHQARRHATADRQAVREQIAKLKKGVSPESPELRQRMIEEMEREAGWPE